MCATGDRAACPQTEASNLDPNNYMVPQAGTPEHFEDTQGIAVPCATTTLNSPLQTNAVLSWSGGANDVMSINGQHPGSKEPQEVVMRTLGAPLYSRLCNVAEQLPDYLQCPSMFRQEQTAALTPNHDESRPPACPQVNQHDSRFSNEAYLSYHEKRAAGHDFFTGSLTSGPSVPISIPPHHSTGQERLSHADASKHSIWMNRNSSELIGHGVQSSRSQPGVVSQGPANSRETVAPATTAGCEKQPPVTQSTASETTHAFTKSVQHWLTLHTHRKPAVPQEKPAPSRTPLLLNTPASGSCPTRPRQAPPSVGATVQKAASRVPKIQQNHSRTQPDVRSNAVQKAAPHVLNPHQNHSRTQPDVRSNAVKDAVNVHTTQSHFLPTSSSSSKGAACFQDPAWRAALSSSRYFGAAGTPTTAHTQNPFCALPSSCTYQKTFNPVSQVSKLKEIIYST